MTGLEKIIAEIRTEAEREAEQTIKNASVEAEKILAEAKAESDAKTARINTSAGTDVADIERSRESAMTLQRRQRTLATKQELLLETRQKALKALYELPEGEYFDLLLRLAANAAQQGKGEMLLSEKDKQRLPKNFTKKLQAALPSGAELAVSEANRPIDGGFVLKYGDVEENCSFASIFAARADEFSDLVREVLFA